MTRWTRRDLGRLAGSIALAGIAAPAIAAASARVVVVGGGPAGATVARYLAHARSRLRVTLVEADARYHTCFFSNLYLAGLRSFDSLAHDYEGLHAKHRVTIVHDTVAAIEPAAKQVRLAGGGKLEYDRLVVAPGIAFRWDAIEGYGEAASEILPHAWRSGEQMRLLRRQLGAMEDGGLFLLTIPPDPIRCPTGPYERVSLVACYFKREKPKSKILVLDSKNSFPKQELFQDAWNRLYPGMVEWLPLDFHGGATSVDPGKRIVSIDHDKFQCAVANVIPPHTAGIIALRTGLADEKGWCPVDPATLESKLIPGVHVVGDAIIPGEMPKSAFAASSQAKVCAMAVAALFAGRDPFEARFFNTCWSFLAPDDAVKIGASYRIVENKIKAVEKFISKVEESAETRRLAARQAEAWYVSITADAFG
jgi:sulfide dehydrogenase [flavocytochrome c] flavoprotein chain